MDGWVTAGPFRANEMYGRNWSATYKSTCDPQSAHCFSGVNRALQHSDTVMAGPVLGNARVSGAKWVVYRTGRVYDVMTLFVCDSR